MIPRGDLSRELKLHGLRSFGEELAVYQCHHHSLFLDRTVSDALGGEGWAVRKQAAFEAAHAWLTSFYAELGVTKPKERLDVAGEIFAAAGHGRLTFDVTAEGGTARGYDLHYGASFADKYGGIIRNRRPVDSFAAGYVSAAASLAFPSTSGTLEAEETSCTAQKPPSLRSPPQAECVFSLTRRPERPRFGVVINRKAIEQMPIESQGGSQGLDKERPALDLSHLLRGAPADESGSIPSLGMRIALIPVSYLNQITYDTVHLIEKRSPELFPIVKSLLCEAASIGAFYLLGGVLAGAPFQAEYGTPAGDPTARLEKLTALTRALGWGALYAEEFVPGRSLVLRSPITHESAYYAIRHGPTARGRLFFHQGVALAIMQLLHRVDFSDPDPIKPDSYESLFKSGTLFHVEETRSPLRGDRLCEVLVEALPDR